MDDVETVPRRAALKGAHQLVFLRQRQRAAMPGLQRRAADNHHRTLRGFECVTYRLGQLCKQAKVIAQPFDSIGQVDLRPDREHFRASFDRLPDPGVHQRRFPAQIAADQQDDVGAFRSGYGRVEIDRGERRDVIVHAGLPPFEQR